MSAAVTQLQTTYVKAVSDPDKEVREEAAPGLGKLLLYGARTEFILKELLRILAASSGVAEVAVLNAILSILQNADEKTAPKGEIVVTLREALLKCFTDAEDLVRAVAARCFGPFAALQTAEEQTALITSLISGPSDWMTVQCGLLSVASIIEKTPKALSTNVETVKSAIARGTAPEAQIPVKQGVSKLIGVILLASTDETLITSLIAKLAEMLNEPSADVKVSVLITIKEVAKKSHATIVKQLPRLIPSILLMAKERKLVRVKFAGERALLHLLQYQKSDAILKKFSKVIEETAAKDLNDYCSRVLSQLGESDDDESLQ